MNIKNKEIMSITDVLINLYNRSKSIHLKWELANVSAPFITVRNMIQQEVNRIILEEGIELEDGKKEITQDNINYQKLMNIETNISFKFVSLSYLKDVDITIDEMLLIKKIVKGD